MIEEPSKRSDRYCSNPRKDSGCRNSLRRDICQDGEKLHCQDRHNKEEYKECEIHNNRIDKHLRLALFFEHLGHFCISGSNGKHFTDLPAHLTCLGNQRDGPCNRRCADPLFKPHQCFGKIRTPVHILLDFPDFITDKPKICVNHYCNSLGNGETGLVDPGHSFKEIRDKFLNAKNFFSPDSIKDGVGYENYKQGNCDMIIDDTEVEFTIGIERNL